MFFHIEVLVYLSQWNKTASILHLHLLIIEILYILYLKRYADLFYIHVKERKIPLGISCDY